MPEDKGGLSICIPVYNKAPLLGRTLESIRRQNIDNLEVVAVDNGSKDDSLKILESWRDRLHLKIYSLPKTISAPENWLLALSLATREFTKLQGADDIIPDGALAALLQKLRDDAQIGFVCGKSLPMDGRGEMIRTGVLHDYWSMVNETRRQMGAARTIEEKGACLARMRIGWSMFGDANSMVFRSKLLPCLRQGVDNLAASFQTWPEYEINLRLFAAADAGFVDMPVSFYSYDEDSHLKKIDTYAFRRRSNDMPAANIVIMLMLDPDLRPLMRAAGWRFALKMLGWHTAKGWLMMRGKK